MPGDTLRILSQTFLSATGSGEIGSLRRNCANILPFQIMHWAALCPTGVVHHDDEGGAEVQDGVQRGAGGLYDQAGQHTRQACQHQIHAERAILILKLDEDRKGPFRKGLKN